MKNRKIKRAAVIAMVVVMVGMFCFTAFTDWDREYYETNYVRVSDYEY